jgi:hypothetical protein
MRSIDRRVFLLGVLLGVLLKSFSFHTNSLKGQSSYRFQARLFHLTMAASDKKGTPEWKEDDMLAGLKDSSATKILKDDFVAQLVRKIMYR